MLNFYCKSVKSATTIHARLLIFVKKIMNKQNKQMPVRYKPLGSRQGPDFYFERSLDLIFSPGTFTVEIDHTNANVGLPIKFCGSEHYIVGTLVVTDSGNNGATQRNRITGQILMFTDRENCETMVYVRTFVAGEWNVWRALVMAGMYDNITTTDELVINVNKLVSEYKTLQSELEKVKIEKSALESFTIVGEVSDKILEYHSFFKNVRVEVISEEVASKYDLTSFALSLLRKGVPEGFAEIRWSVFDKAAGTRRYFWGEGEYLDLTSINNYGYTHVEQVKNGIKIAYDVDLANPLFPRSAFANNFSTEEPVMFVSRDRVNMAIENIIKEHLPETEINYGNLFDENKGHYIKLNQVVCDAKVVAPAPEQAADNWSYAVVDVVEGETYCFSAKGSLYVAAWAVVNSDGYVIEHSPLSASYIKDYTLIIPKNAVKLIVNCLNQSPYTDERPSLELVTNTAKDIKTLTDKVNDINSSMQSSTVLKGKKILCLGDSITEGAGYDGYRYSDHIARLTGAVVYNCGSGGAHMEQRNELLDNPANIHEAYAAFDLPSVVDAIVSGNFSKQEAACEFLKDTNDRSAVLNVIKSVVLSEIDVVTIFIGTNDYGNGEENLGAVGDLTPLRNSLGGFGHAVKTLLTANPNIRIYYFCPMVRYFGALSDAWDDHLWSDNLVNAQGVKFTDMVGKMVDNARFWKIPVCDMYNTLGINQYNIASVMKEDGSEGVHPKRGYRMIANKMVSFIISNNNLNV